MASLVRSSAALAITAVTGATAVAGPVDPPATAAPSAENSAAVNLTASSSSLVEPGLAADQIDESFLDFRTGVREEFNAFANRLGYLGKQMYIGFNFGESVLASAVFNGTDILRGEGLFENLSEFAVDIALAAAWVVADELYLHIEDLPPIEILLNRPPRDAAPGWTRPQPPDPVRPLVPEPDAAAAVTDADVEEPSAFADEVDQSFIEARHEFRTAFTPLANQLGYVGKQLYIAANFVESLVASVVFNGTDILRGEGFLKNLGEIGSDVLVSGLWIGADELYLHVPGLPPIDVLPNRGPADAPQGWRRPLPPQPGRDLVVPVPYVGDLRPEATATRDEPDGRESGSEETQEFAEDNPTTSRPPTTSQAGGEDAPEQDAPTRKTTKADNDKKADQPVDSEDAEDAGGNVKSEDAGGNEGDDDADSATA